MTLAQAVLNIAGVKSAFQPRICVLMPVLDDWASAGTLISDLDRALAPAGCTVQVLLIDDGSREPGTGDGLWPSCQNIESIRILRLRRNLGHQRAICIGLLHVNALDDSDAVLVMDADGEDTAGGALALVEAFLNLGGGHAVFAERSKRSESLSFRCFYHLYKAMHYVLTGVKIKVGNFSVLPVSYLRTLAVMPELWNHYAAAVFRSRLPLKMVAIPRGHRIAGQSRMNFVSLVAHGLSAVMAFGEVVGVRLLIGSLAGCFGVAGGIVAIACIRMFTDRAIPGWATYTAAALIVIGMQLLTMAITFAFVVLSSRTNLGFVPVRDYAFFVGECVQVLPARSKGAAA